MDGHALKTFLLDKPEAAEDFPFGEDVAVYRVCKKMFALVGTNKEGVLQVNLKCDPDQAAILRDIFEAVLPGYHMNKKHWNTVLLNHTIPATEIERMIDHSYALVVSGLSKKIRDSLELKYGVEKLYRGFS